MQRIIETELGDALVEFNRYDEDGKIVNEITGIFLPEGLDVYDSTILRRNVRKAFHNGEGYNL